MNTLGGGLEVPAELRRPTALASVSYYNQIALRTQSKLVEIKGAGDVGVLRRDGEMKSYIDLLFLALVILLCISKIVTE
jgi:hypothetical protein